MYASHTLTYVPRAGEQLASLTATNRALEPEEFTNNELGLKWDLSDRLAATVAIYELERTNVAITDPTNPTLSILVDGQRVNGTELGLSGRISDRWQMMAGYAYQNSEIQTPERKAAMSSARFPSTRCPSGIATTSARSSGSVWASSIAAMFS